MTPRYLMIARGGRHEIEIRKSWFICTANRANTEEEARGYAESIRREFWDASHNCVAWVIGDDGRFQRSNDDGEPAGTAGMPMLEVLRRRTITDTVVVVTRATSAESSSAWEAPYALMGNRWRTRSTQSVS